MDGSETERLRIADLELLVVLGATGSFTETAARTGLARSSVSRRVAELEGLLGSVLFDRTTRRPTAAGRRFLDHAAAALESARDAIASIHQAPEGLRGSITASAPPILGSLVMVPAVLTLLVENPGARVELEASSAYRDLELDRVDVALRLGEDDRGHAGSVLGEVPFWLVGARPGITEPDQLTAADLLGSQPIRLQKDRAEVRIPVEGRLRTGDYGALLAAARAGIGFARLPRPMVAGLVRAGQLHRAVPDWRCGAAMVRCLVRRRARPLARRLAALIHDSPQLAALLAGPG